ncbi:hypothetical protein KUTeg_023504 [Tegillarca granosa]|uniref:Uncharacterized protein n=1 Tax=Tegillarca granosa TaxID=220873 RepID=A0ABQ9E597_TEGGR|nr:hypothetical protein KUTeg_023504 [Tegillarca granosa]
MIVERIYFDFIVKDTSKNQNVIIALCIGIVAVLMLVCVVVWRLWKRKRNTYDVDHEEFVSLNICQSNIPENKYRNY